MTLSPVENVIKFQADISFEVKKRNHSKHWSYVLFLYLFVCLFFAQDKKKRRAENLRRRAENERKAEIVQVVNADVILHQNSDVSHSFSFCGCLFKQLITALLSD